MRCARGLLPVGVATGARLGGLTQGLRQGLWQAVDTVPVPLLLTALDVALLWVRNLAVETSTHGYQPLAACESTCLCGAATSCCVCCWGKCGGAGVCMLRFPCVSAPYVAYTSSCTQSLRPGMTAVLVA
mgnify:CR=1 FL=1